LLTALCSAVPATPPDARVYVGDISSQMIMGNLVHTSTVLLRRERFEQVGGFDESLKPSGEDFDFHLRTCRAGPVAYADIASIQYRVKGADQLSRSEYGIHVARNFLRTIEPVLKEDKHRIRLPASMLTSVQAEAHAWLGRELLAHGDRPGARKHLAESLRYRSLVPSAWLLYAMSCGPSFAYPVARGVVRAAKRALRRTEQV
jgi:GT2 family glycosyltransferase